MPCSDAVDVSREATTLSEPPSGTEYTTHSLLAGAWRSARLGRGGMDPGASGGMVPVRGTEGNKYYQAQVAGHGPTMLPVTPEQATTRVQHKTTCTHPCTRKHAHTAAAGSTKEMVSRTGRPLHTTPPSHCDSGEKSKIQTPHPYGECHAANTEEP